MEGGAELCFLVFEDVWGVCTAGEDFDVDLFVGGKGSSKSGSFTL